MKLLKLNMNTLATPSPWQHPYCPDPALVLCISCFLASTVKRASMQIANATPLAALFHSFIPVSHPVSLPLSYSLCLFTSLSLYPVVSTRHRDSIKHLIRHLESFKKRRASPGLCTVRGISERSTSLH